MKLCDKFLSGLFRKQKNLQRSAKIDGEKREDCLGVGVNSTQCISHLLLPASPGMANLYVPIANMFIACTRKRKWTSPDGPNLPVSTLFLYLSQTTCVQLPSRKATEVHASRTINGNQVSLILMMRFSHSV